MADRIPKEKRSEIMSRIRSANTKPELLLRRAMWRMGFRYRVNDRRLPGKPDIVLPRYRTVVFVHGCFWHGHEGCKNYTVPKTNIDFWTAKVARNRERDQEEWRRLEAMGWSVVIVWECQLKKAELDETVSRVAEEILRNGENRKKEREERKLSRLEYLSEQKSRKERTAILMREITLRRHHPH